MAIQRFRFVTALVCLVLGTCFATLSRPTLAADQVFVGAGDIADCSTVSAAASGAEQTAKLLDGISGTVFTLGDNVYPTGAATDFTNCYDPTWGRHKADTHPAPGNHDYDTSGAAPYYSYFGASAGAAGKGYYSYNVGAWHIIALNSEIDVSATSAEAQWLRADLAANPAACTLAYWHEPLYSSGQHGNLPQSQELWKILHQAGADVVLNGHDHDYERFAPQDPYGRADANGIREFVVGTGGSDRRGISIPRTNSEVFNSSSFGVLKLTLHAGSYDWQFIPVAGSTFTDSGSATCFNGSNPTATPTNTATPLPAGQTQLTINPTADTYVDSAAPGSAFATKSQLLAVDGSTSEKRSFLRFDVAGIPAGTTVTSAKLRLYVVNQSTSGGIFNTTADTAWTETVTWDTQPGLGPQLAALGAITAGTAVTVDVSSVVASNGAYGFAISSPRGNTDTLGYGSRESSLVENRPQLVITTQTGPLPTNTPTSTPTDTPTFTSTFTPTDTPPATSTATNSPTANLAATSTPTNTPAITPTNSPTSTPSSTATATPLGSSAPIKSITFENGSLVNASTGVDSTSGTLTLQTSAPLKGSFSVSVPDTTSYGSLTQNFTAMDELFVSFYFKPANFPASARIALLQNSGTTVGNLVLSSNGTLQLRNGSSAIGGASPALSKNTLYRIGLHQRRGTGANGVLEAYLATGDAPFGAPFATSASQSFTTQANKLQFGATNSNRVDATFDDITLDGKAMPAPSGSAIAARVVWSA